MYPQGELRRLAAHKRWLQRRIARQRLECVEGATCLLQPVAWIDRALEQWRKISPMLKLAAVLTGVVAKRSAVPRTRSLAAVLRWGPLLLSVVRGFRGARR